MKEFEILITSPPDRENLVAEIWQDDQMIAEINQEGGVLGLEIYATKEGTIKLKYNDFIEALKKAKEKLIGK
ncbi:MAG: hypothetical protein RBR84_10945 [Bacteroidales bacterium]|jgi:uncharacterized protein YuzE|nr:hypothetical protein [Bacteroidales bacterium]